MALMECPYCHTTETGHVYKSIGVQCRNCGIYRLKQRMDASRQKRFLELIDASLDPTSGVHAELRVASCSSEISLLRRVCPTVLDGGRILDVGSSEGSVVAALAQSGANVSGLEPLRKLAESARKKHLDIRHGYFEEGCLAGLENERYDLISFREVFYYFADLKAVFSLVRRLLKPNGRVYIKSHQPRSYYYWGSRKLTARYGEYVQGMATLPVLKKIMKDETFHVSASGYFRSRVLGNLYRGVVPTNIDKLFSRIASPVLAGLNLEDRYWVIAQK